MRALIFGEVLFDRFPDGRSVLGGAPFNVAWNLRQLGRDPLFLGGIGRDPEGREVAGSMQAIGLDASGLQWIEGKPTGQVTVELVDAEPRYTILPDQAYDHLQPEPLRSVLPAEPWILYHGSLALRTAGNRALCSELAAVAGSRLVDVNLRAPWYGVDSVLDSLAGADCVKLNREELAELSGLDDEEQAVRHLFARCGIRDSILVTAGRDGARIHAADGAVWSAPAPPVEGFVDAVGAGDAFASVVILGMIRGWDREVMLHRALDFAARICTLRGATTTDPRFYEDAAVWRSSDPG